MSRKFYIHDRFHLPRNTKNTIIQTFCILSKSTLIMIHYLNIANILGTLTLIGYLAYNHTTHEIPVRASTSVSSVQPLRTASTLSMKPKSQQPSTEEKIISNYFETQITELRRMASEQNNDIENELPTSDEILLAAQSKSITSPASKIVIDKIQTTSNLLNSDYISPISK